MKTSLYEIALAYRADAEKLSDMDMDETTLADTLEGMSGELEVKAQNTAYVLRNLESSAQAIKDAEAQMTARRKAIENRASRIKDYLLTSMLVAGVQKIECPHFKLAVRENPPAVEVYEPGLIPSEFMRQPPIPEPVPDKKAIAEAIKGGQDVPGCKATRSTRLEIK